MKNIRRKRERTKTDVFTFIIPVSSNMARSPELTMQWLFRTFCEISRLRWNMSWKISKVCRKRFILYVKINNFLPSILPKCPSRSTELWNNSLRVFHLFILVLLAADSAFPKAFTSLCSSLITVAKACGFTPFSHNRTHMLNVAGSKFVFNNLDIWFSVWNVLRAAFTWWLTGSGMLARFCSFLEQSLG